MHDHSSSAIASSNLIIFGGCNAMFGQQDEELVESLKKTRNFDSTAFCLDYNHRFQYLKRQYLIICACTNQVNRKWLLFSKNHCTLMICFLERKTMRRPLRFIRNRRESWRTENSSSEHGTLTQRQQEDSFMQRKAQPDVIIGDDQSYANTTTGSASPSSKDDFVVKVLGLNRNTLSDELFFDFSCLHTYAMSLPLSKRSFLKLRAKIFDPMGFLTPFTTGLKILFQELCVGKINWDETPQGTLLG